MTVELNEMMYRAANQVHNNFQSVAGSVEEDFDYPDSSRVLISFSFAINYSDQTLGGVWEACVFTLTAMRRVARLFAESFSLPMGHSWYERLESYKVDLAELDKVMKHQIAEDLPS